MTTTTTTTTNTNGTQASAEKTEKRGRKRIEDGGKPSPRKVYVTCASVRDGTLLFEDIHCVSADKDTKDADVLAEAKVLFKKRFGIVPQQMSRPHFGPRKEIGTQRKRESINVAIEDITFVPGRKAMAEYRGWRVAVKFIDGMSDAAYIFYKEHLTEEKKTKPANKAIRLEALENLVEETPVEPAKGSKASQASA